jgi:hypothetical protein
MVLHELEERKQILLALNNQEIRDNLEFFRKLDNEYPKYAKSNRTIYDYTIFKLSHIQDKNWRGLWYKATGIDSQLYINWLYHGLTLEDSEKSIIELYKEAHPSEKYVPYSITLANQTLNNIKEKNHE